MPQSSRWLTLAIGLALGACAGGGWHTYAHSPAPAAEAAQLAASRSAEPSICRTDVSTGSLLPHRECHTQRDWDQIAQGQILKLNQDAARSPAAMNPAGLSPPVGP